MTNTVTFSVVIAAYNQQARVLDAVESVSKQFYAPHEIILVDDGSVDGTADAVRRRFPGVTVLTQENQGKGIARNRGAFLSTGEWVCFLDHDDLWHPEKLQCVAAHIADHPDALAVDHPVWIFREAGDARVTAWGLEVDFTADGFDEAVIEMNRLRQPRNDFSYLERSADSYGASLRRVFSTTSALSIRRDAFFIAGGFPPSQANGEDWTLCTNVARLGAWHTIPRALSCQRVLADSGTEEPEAGMMILSSLASHWYGGRPYDKRAGGLGYTDQLERYAPSYVHLAQAVIWEALRKHRLRSIGHGVCFAVLLLPRWRSRLRAVTPPPITWWLDRIRQPRRPHERRSQSTLEG